MDPAKIAIAFAAKEVASYDTTCQFNDEIWRMKDCQSGDDCQCLMTARSVVRAYMSAAALLHGEGTQEYSILMAECDAIEAIDPHAPKPA